MKTNQILKLFLISCFLSIFNSCDVEEEYIKTNNAENYQVKNVSFEEFKSKRNIFEKFKNTPQIIDASNPIQRIIYDDQYGVYYDTDNIIRIEKQDYISYTIPLVRETANETIKNLVVFEKQNEPVKVKMITYTLNEEEINKIKNNEIIDISAKTSSQSLVTNSSYTNSWYDDSGCLVTATTTIIAGNKCAQGRHNYGDPCDLTGSQAATPQRVVVKYTYAFCPPDGPSSGGGPNLDPGGGGGGGGGTIPESPTDNPNDTPSYPENQDEVITTPIIPGLSGEVPEKTPCQKVKDITNNTTGLKPIINNFKTPQVLNLNHEKGFNLVDNSQNQTQLIQNDGNANSTSITVVVTADGAMTGVVHSHFDRPDMLPTFTFEDLMTFNSIYQWRKYNEKSLDNLTLMVVSRAGVFAMQIEDEAIFATNGYNLWTDQNTQLYNDFYKNVLGRQNLTDEDVIIEVTKGLSNYGIGMYEANTDLSNWSKLTVDENNNKIATPCN